jgi:5-methylcytosine-specific restriction enzyme A
MPTIKRLPKKPRNYKTATREERYKIYRDKKWAPLRASKLKEQPLCELCLIDGKLTPATQCHHVEWLTDNIARAFDYENLSSVCADCHGKIHGSATFRASDTYKQFIKNHTNDNNGDDFFC